MVYPDEGFNAHASLQAISDEKLTSVYGVPTMFIEMLRVNDENKGKFDLSSIRTGIIAGSVAPRPVNYNYYYSIITILYHLLLGIRKNY